MHAPRPKPSDLPDIAPDILARLPAAAAARGPGSVAAETHDALAGLDGEILRLRTRVGR